jgi:hypothetical protein
MSNGIIERERVNPAFKLGMRDIKMMIEQIQIFISVLHK